MYFFGKSDIGKVRSTNQDSFRINEISEGVVCCVVCDGMGGMGGGDIASELAIETFCRSLEKLFAPESENSVLIHSALASAVSDANSRVFERGNSDITLKGMGTTLVTALLYDRVAYIANVGDSRIYHITEGSITQISRDHSYVQYLVDIGQLSPEEAETAPMKNIITRSVGSESEVDADFYDVELSVGDYLLLCTDGLTNSLGTDEMLGIITGEGLLEDKTNRLVADANDAGGNDNITAVLVYINDDEDRIGVTEA